VTDVDLCRRILAERSLSFRLAGRLLPARERADAAVVYAWCRRADDAVDERPPAEHAAALRALRLELAAIDAGDEVRHPVARAFADVVHRRGLGVSEASDLLDGMAMDARGVRYRSLDDLLLYAYRAAGSVGIMMARVLGVRRREALRHAAHLGMAMQLTNICRDVREDLERGRVYLPEELLGGEPPAPGPRLQAAVRRLLAEADALYRSGDRGLAFLPWRASIAIGAARRIYAAIGAEIARRGWDVLAGRAVVSRGRKLFHLAGAVAAGLAALPARLAAPPSSPPAQLPAVRYPDDVLPR
jgi:phytoene synthase